MNRIIVGTAFTVEMQRKLDKHQDRTPEWPKDLLVAKLLREVAGLIEAVHVGNEHLTFMEAADVANLAMLVAGGYEVERRATKEEL